VIGFFVCRAWKALEVNSGGWGGGWGGEFCCAWWICSVMEGDDGLGVGGWCFGQVG